MGTYTSERPTHTSSPGVSASALRSAIGHFATGVTVITALADDGRPYASTANAVSSVSLDPPLVLVCLREESQTLAALLGTQRFAVNVLREDQHALARHFAKAAVHESWQDIDHHRGRDGIPLLGGAVSTLECSLHDVADGGDHRIVIGQVHDVEHPDAHVAPLVFYRGAFASLHEPAESPPVEAPDALIPTPDGDLRLIAIDQERRSATSAIALIGQPQDSDGALVYLHRGCLFGDALGHLECKGRLALADALKRMRAQGSGVIVYHRDDGSPFSGCCVPHSKPAPAGDYLALRAIGETLAQLDLRAVRLLSPTVGIDTAQMASAIGLDVAKYEPSILSAQDFTSNESQ
jgi:flavin reductase (DIM6/NTAB) family NADH-FMN oxidoreductase RutF